MLSDVVERPPTVAPWPASVGPIVARGVDTVSPQQAWVVPGSEPPPEQPAYPRFQGGFPTLGPASATDTTRASWLSFTPGIVGLKPLSVSEVLGGALKLLRFNPRSTIGLSLIVQIVVLVFALPFTLMLIPGMSNGSSTIMGTFAPLILSGTPRAIGGVILSAMLAYVTLQAVLGRKPGVPQVWQVTKSRMLPYLGTTLMLVLGVALLVTGWVWLAISLEFPFAFSVLLGLPAVAVSIWLTIKLSFLGPAMVLERLPAIAAVRRSWSLTRGRVGPIFGTQILANFSASMVASMLATPVQLAVLLIATMSLQDRPGLQLTVTMLASVLTSAISNSFLAPYLAGVNCLLYVDARMRAEGLDLVLMNEAARGVER